VSAGRLLTARSPASVNTFASTERTRRALFISSDTTAGKRRNQDHGLVGGLPSQHQPHHQRIVYRLPPSAHQPHRGGGLKETQGLRLPAAPLTSSTATPPADPPTCPPSPAAALARFPSPPHRRGVDRSHTTRAGVRRLTRGVGVLGLWPGTQHGQWRRSSCQSAAASGGGQRAQQRMLRSLLRIPGLRTLVRLCLYRNASPTGARSSRDPRHPKPTSPSPPPADVACWYDTRGLWCGVQCSGGGRHRREAPRYGTLRAPAVWKHPLHVRTVVIYRTLHPVHPSHPSSLHSRQPRPHTISRVWDEEGYRYAGVHV
jgi:hypothetical protein